MLSRTANPDKLFTHKPRFLESNNRQTYENIASEAKKLAVEAKGRVCCAADFQSSGDRVVSNPAIEKCLFVSRVRDAGRRPKRPAIPAALDCFLNYFRVLIEKRLLNNRNWLMRKWPQAITNFSRSPS